MLIMRLMSLGMLMMIMDRWGGNCDEEDGTVSSLMVAKIKMIDWRNVQLIFKSLMMAVRMSMIVP